MLYQSYNKISPKLTKKSILRHGFVILMDLPNSQEKPVFLSFFTDVEIYIFSPGRNEFVHSLIIIL